MQQSEEKEKKFYSVLCNCSRCKRFRQLSVLMEKLDADHKKLVEERGFWLALQEIEDDMETFKQRIKTIDWISRDITFLTTCKRKHTQEQNSLTCRRMSRGNENNNKN